MKSHDRELDSWANIKEKGSVTGLKLLFWIYKLLGRCVFLVILHPVILYYVLTARKARQSSKQYLDYLSTYNGISKTAKFKDIYSHFYSFGVYAVDKIATWVGDINKEDLTFHNIAILEELENSSQGAVFIGAHLGNLELFRAVGERSSSFKINAVVFQKNAVTNRFWG
jgi:predicted LPLAT superfamily acyltransferase